MPITKKIIVSFLIVFTFQNSTGQNTDNQERINDIYKTMADSNFDIVIRLDNEMNDNDVNARVKIIKSFVSGAEISYSRDSVGNIKTLLSSGGLSSSSCESDNFGFLVVALKDNEWKGCMIADRD
ncbi:hypothetical protein [Euzebyella saccharophila]|uniref:Uncharacterized protein n=1 Tax=Euzebyella saccharophila TaxID=679664 RepID=A0ABV8JNI3_9FLAO|nr:hypothetical protein [Euzebyella saccharophila]